MVLPAINCLEVIVGREQLRVWWGFVFPCCGFLDETVSKFIPDDAPM